MMYLMPCKIIKVMKIISHAYTSEKEEPFVGTLAKQHKQENFECNVIGKVQFEVG